MTLMPVCPKCHEENPQLGARCPRDGHYFIPKSALADAKKDPLIGTIAADKYVILGLISEGGMGAVYRALQLPVEREVALKVLRTELQDSDQGRDRFILEARAVSRLSHPNIIVLHDFGFDSNNHPYMVMEYAPGKSLARWLRDDVDIDRIVHVMEQVLSALSEAHDRGIVHRDLKPENMIITKAGTDRDYVKLLDFGIARLINEGSTRKLTREGEVFGTPHYMAPEQAQGKKNVGPPADVYACGIIFWELICGHCPFDAPTPLAVLFMHINEPIPPLQPRPGITVPDEIAKVIAHATQKQALSRYQHAGEMLSALRSAVDSIIDRNTLSGSNRVRAIESSAPKPRPAPEPKPAPRNPTFDPSRPLNLASQAESVDSSGSLPVYDPDPSLEREGLRRRSGSSAGANVDPTPRTTNPPEEDRAKLKLSLAALGILLALAGVVVASVLVLGGETATDAEAAESETAESETATAETTANEPEHDGPAVAKADKVESDNKPADSAAAANAKKSNDTPAEQTSPNSATTISANPPNTQATAQKSTETKEKVDPSSVAGHAPPGTEPDNKPEKTKTAEQPTDQAPSEKATTTKTTTKTAKTTKSSTTTKTSSTKISAKTEPKTSNTSSDGKTTAPAKDEPTKFEPKAFDEPPPMKWKK